MTKFHNILICLQYTINGQFQFEGSNYRRKEKEGNIFYYMVIFLTNEIVSKVAEDMVEYTRVSIKLAREG